MSQTPNNLLVPGVILHFNFGQLFVPILIPPGWYPLDPRFSPLSINLLHISARYLGHHSETCFYSQPNPGSGSSVSSSDSVMVLIHMYQSIGEIKWTIGELQCMAQGTSLSWKMVSRMLYLHGGGNWKGAFWSTLVVTNWSSLKVSHVRWITSIVITWSTDA